MVPLSSTKKKSEEEKITVYYFLREITISDEIYLFEL